MSKIKLNITFFLAFYMLLLVFIPCTDACTMENHDQSALVENAQNHHEEHADVCSPLCSCSCCSSQITFTEIQSFETVNTAEIRSFIMADAAFYHPIYFSIWQPPKLS